MKKEEFLKKIVQHGYRHNCVIEHSSYAKAPNIIGCFREGNEWKVYTTLPNSDVGWECRYKYVSNAYKLILSYFGIIDFVDCYSLPRTPIVKKENGAVEKFINENKLLRIALIEDKIDMIMGNLNEYIEYRYSYDYIKPIKCEDGTFEYLSKVGYCWTTDEKHPRLTGEKRTVNYVYYGYQIINNNGRFQLIETRDEEDLRVFPKDYTYIKEVFYKKVSDGIELDYEDGPLEMHQLTEEQMVEYQEQKQKGKVKCRTKN